MKKILLIFVLCSNNIFSAEVHSLSIVIRGRLISAKELIKEKVVKDLNGQVKEMKLFNSFQKELIILGRTEIKPFAYKIEKGVTKTYKVEAKEITELYYILDGKKHKLEKYSDLNI